jgi:hypothetical protein
MSYTQYIFRQIMQSSGITADRQLLLFQQQRFYFQMVNPKGEKGEPYIVVSKLFLYFNNNITLKYGMYYLRYIITLI